MKRNRNKPTSEDEKWLRLLAALYNIDLNVCEKCKSESRIKFSSCLRRMFQCGKCGNQINPMSRTPFAKSHQSPKKMCTLLKNIGKEGITIKQVQRNLNITYKTACRWYYLAKTTSVNTDLIPNELTMDFTTKPTKQENEFNKTHATKWRKANPDKVKKLKQRAAAKLPDHYIKGLLKSDDKDLIAAKRAQLQLMREIREQLK